MTPPAKLSPEQIAGVAHTNGLVTAAGDGPVLVRLDSVTPERVTWAWPRRIALGKLALFIGDPGDGKTYVTNDVAARFTRGLEWPDGGTAPLANVVALVAEDGLADTYRPRVEGQGGDPARVYVLRAVRHEGQEHPFTFEEDLVALETALRDTSARLLVVDPLSAYLGRRDSYKDAEIRAVLTPLAVLAEQHHCAIIGVLHLTKDRQRRLLLRAQGNIAFVAQARTVFAIGPDPETPGRRLLVTVKNNLGVFAPGLAFRIGADGLQWEPGTVEGAAEQLLAADDPSSRTERREREGATEFLRTALSTGPMASKELMADAKANGISQRTLWRAKTELGIVAERHGRGPWYWMLPHAEPGS
jgi:hypothetical protein